MGKIEIRNARIEDTFLGAEDHGIFTAILYLSYTNAGQAFGLYALDKYDDSRKTRIGTAYGAEFILRILRTVGVDKWESLKGRLIRVKATRTKVHAIGNIIEERWFTPDEDLDYVKE